jgi:homoserine O-succinyltransferase/O-acetyltransferase
MLTIGLLNNMSPAAITSTERQFQDILTEAAHGLPLVLRWFRISGARPANYGSVDDLWDSKLDGLIITGSEPRTPLLTDEPIWPALTQTIDWAAANTGSTVFSCLAAHAAVLHLDGVKRQPRPSKIFGAFDSVKVADHAILEHVPRSWRVPHSRWNDLPEFDLTACGYQVLAKSIDAGVDIFVKRVLRSLFVFVQSHPEYDGSTLIREYRRDVSRFRGGQRDQYPEMPRNYFDPLTTELVQGSHDVLDRIEVANDWRPVAVQLYHNWLMHLAHETAYDRQ